MSARTLTRVDSWETRSFTGYDGLSRLAGAEFSGAVRTGDVVLFMLNGRIIGVSGGTLDAFEDASGTAYEAPDPALPLLFAMQEQDGETQAKYYTNDTPLSEVDETLDGSNFTGYIELSENVLSGDYYVVYYGGRSMSVAFVGANGELVTGDEAFERAADEVGIYEVVKAGITVRELPEPEGDRDDAEAESDASTAGTAATPPSDPEAADDPQVTDESESADETAGAASEDASGAEADASGDDADEAREEDAERPDDRAPAEASAGEASETDEEGGAGSEAADAGDGEDDPDGTAVETRDPDPGSRSPPAKHSRSGPADGGGEREVFEEETQWQETRSIPALAPEEDESETDAGESSGVDASRSERGSGDERGERRAPADAERRPSRDDDRTAELRERLEERAAELERARERVAAVEEERDTLRAERDDLREEREALESEVERLREELAEARANAGAAHAEGDGAAGGRTLSPEQALDRTNLFIRYASRSRPTLADVRSGADAEEVAENLRLDYHAQFDADAVVVDGEPFESFLEDTLEHQFVTWLVEELPFEIRETGQESALAGLVEAFPDVDRAELRGSVEVETEDGTERREFDVILRDRVGTALVVADLNTERAPVTGDGMERLRDAASDVALAGDLGAAFYVTASFFEPDALEVATNASSGGLLSRDSRKSFVKASRKSGYHLCLVEARNGSFYLSVPEL